MNIKQGEIINESTNGIDFTVKRVVRNMVVLESQDGERQVLTEMHMLASSPLYLKTPSAHLVFKHRSA